MTFYLKPPNCYIQLPCIENDLHTRFNFFLKIKESNENCVISHQLLKFAFKSDCLILGSRRDVASHFLIRLGIAILNDDQLQEFWSRAEAKLFRYHLFTGKLETIKSSLEELKTEGKKLIENNKTRNAYIHSLKYAIKVADEVLSHPHLDCTQTQCQFYIKVPWQMVREMISERSIELHSGFATVPCSKILSLLTCLFKELLFCGIKQLQCSNIVLNDERIASITKLISTLYYRKHYSLLNRSPAHFTLTYSDINKEVGKFPLCMQRLNKQLMSCHRVRHHKRIIYSLFLKDIGLSLEQNVLFWKDHYRRPLCSNTGCSHTWEGASSRRYEYSLRHMYGLEGKRTNYKAHSCASLQVMRAQPQECSGCPFTYPHDDSLERDLEEHGKFLWPDQKRSIVMASQAGNPSLSCGLFLGAMLHKHHFNTRKLTHFPSASMVSVTKHSFHKNRKAKSMLDTSYTRLRKGLKASLTAGNGSDGPGKVRLGNRIDVLKGTLVGKPDSPLPSSRGGCDQHQQKCELCSYESIPPIMSFSSPEEYYHAVKYFQVP